MNKNNWWIIGIVALVVFVLAFGGGMMTNGWGHRSYSMMGNYGGYGTMGGWGFSPLGWLGMGFGMLFMWGIPLGATALIVFGIVALTRNNNPAPHSPQQTCPHCAKDVQTDWNTCPYCGTNLK